jgi:hypothetical protein
MSTSHSSCLRSDDQDLMQAAHRGADMLMHLPASCLDDTDAELRHLSVMKMLFTAPPISDVPVQCHVAVDQVRNSLMTTLEARQLKVQPNVMSASIMLSLNDVFKTLSPPMSANSESPPGLSDHDRLKLPVGFPEFPPCSMFEQPSVPALPTAQQQHRNDDYFCMLDPTSSMFQQIFTRLRSNVARIDRIRRDQLCESLHLLLSQSFVVEKQRADNLSAAALDSLAKSEAIGSNAFPYHVAPESLSPELIAAVKAAIEAATATMDLAGQRKRRPVGRPKRQHQELDQNVDAIDRLPIQQPVSMEVSAERWAGCKPNAKVTVHTLRDARCSSVNLYGAINSTM